MYNVCLVGKMKCELEAAALGINKEDREILDAEIKKAKSENAFIETKINESKYARFQIKQLREQKKEYNKTTKANKEQLSRILKRLYSDNLTSKQIDELSNMADDLKVKIKDNKESKRQYNEEFKKDVTTLQGEIRKLREH